MTKKELKELIRECIQESQTNNVKLIDIYDGSIPDDESALGEYVRPKEWDMYYPTKTLSVDELKTLRAFYSGDNIVKDFNERKDRSSISKVNGLRKLIKTNQDVGMAVVSNDLIIDGHHRVIASITENKPLTVVDIEVPVK